MSRSSFAALALFLALPPTAAAQEGPRPNLVFTIFGGVTTGYDLWRVDRQPLCVLHYDGGGSFSCPGTSYDTVGLGRRDGGKAQDRQRKDEDRQHRHLHLVRFDLFQS